MSPPADLRPGTRLRIDRVACTAHGACASLLPGRVGLDEHGYPIVHDDLVDPDTGATIVRLCPARAVWLER
jgi:ferredoxin